MSQSPHTGFAYRSPGHRLVFGWNALDRLAEEVAALPARKPFLVCSTRAAQSVAGRTIVGALGIAPEALFSGVRAHAPLASVHEAWGQARGFEPDCVVALGGGSAADTAKGLILALAEEGRVLDFELERTRNGELRGRSSSRPKLPLVAIPTTLSGAEITTSFSVTDDCDRKRIIRDPSLAASLLVYGPALLRALPLSTLASSAMNALAHGCEALYSKARNPVSALFACESLRLLHKGLAAALTDGGDEAYEELALGAYHAAVAIVNARTALHHAICHKLAPAAGLAHGIANAIVLPRVLEFNLPAARAELTDVARLFSVETHTPDAAIVELARLRERAGLPGRLREVGVKQALLSSLAESVLAEPGLAFNPREVTSAHEIEGILNAAW